MWAWSFLWQISFTCSVVVQALQSYLPAKTEDMQMSYWDPFLYCKAALEGTCSTKMLTGVLLSCSISSLRFLSSSWSDVIRLASSLRNIRYNLNNLKTNKRCGIKFEMNRLLGKDFKPAISLLCLRNSVVLLEQQFVIRSVPVSSLHNQLSLLN